MTCQSLYYTITVRTHNGIQRKTLTTKMHIFSLYLPENGVTTYRFFFFRPLFEYRQTDHTPASLTLKQQ